MGLARRRTVRDGEFNAFVDDPWPFKVPIKGGYFALVDEDDLDLLLRFHWHLARKGTCVYAIRTTRTAGDQCIGFTMHGSIIGIPLGGFVVDHINGYGLDNRRANLRVVSRSANGANSNSTWRGTSRFKGVYFCRDRSRWRVQLQVMGRTRRVGSFREETDAAIAYDEAAWAAWGPFARLNFPELIPGSNPISAARPPAITPA